MRKIMIFTMAFLLVMVSFSGCLDSGSDSDSDGEESILYHPDLKVGDKWTVEVNTESWMTMTITMEIISTNSNYEGESAIEGTFDITVDDYENSTVKIENFSGSGTLYWNEENLETIYRKSEMSGTYNYKTYNTTINDMTIITETNYDHTGEEPDKIKVGDKWTITETKEETTTYKSGGDVLNEETETIIETKNYEVTGKTEITVPAGTFNTTEVEWDQEDGSSYGTEYYSEKAKLSVKDIEHSDDGDSTTELLSYEVS